MKAAKDEFYRTDCRIDRAYYLPYKFKFLGRIGKERNWEKMKETIYYCDFCGNKSKYPWKVRRYIFKVTIGSDELCDDCYEQLKELRKANLMLQRKEK